MTKLIAEIGWNHMGDMVLAKEMIAAAAESGADYVKFQTWKLDRLKKGSWDEDGRREIYQKAELSVDQHHELKEFCDSNNIEFFTSVFSVEDADLLKTVESKVVKIPSFESVNWALLESVNRNFDWIFMSTGASDLAEIRASMDLLDRAKTTLLHCVSTYPCPPEKANLPKIPLLRRVSDHVGYSDHVEGVEVAKMSLQYEVEVIEKHFTIDNDLPGRDNKFAVLPNQLRKLRDFIDEREKAMTFLGEDFQSIEVDSRENYRGRFDG